MYNYFDLIKADYLQRTRNYAFLITLIVSVYFAYTLVPPVHANYQTVRVGDYIGEQNSAWIGHITAIMSSVFLWIIGFYLINNGIKRDIETGVGQIIATTGVSNFKYLLAKALSNFLVLLTIVIIVMLMGLVLFLIRGSGSFDPVQFFFPFLFCTVPSIFVVSVIAVVAEVFLGRSQNIQHIAFFVLVMVLLKLNSSNNAGQSFLDAFGVNYLTHHIADVVNTTYSKTDLLVSVGFQIGTKSKHVFLFKGTDWSALFLLSRLLWVAFSFVLLFISARLFHRFDVKEVAVKKVKNNKVANDKRLAGDPKEIRLSELPIATVDLSIFPFLKTELLMLFRKGPRWFWLFNLGGFIALFFVPISIAHKFVLPVIWFLQINRWADIATKEKQFGTHYFTYAAYKPLQRLLTSQIIAGIVLALALSAPLIMRYAINGDLFSAFSIIIGAMFLISCSVCLGIISGSDRLFNILFFMLSYANLNVIPALDYYGAINKGMLYLLIMMGLTSLMLFIAYVCRKLEIRNQ